MRTILCKGSLGILALLLASNVSAATITYIASLNGANEVPPVSTPATGFATLTLTGDTLSVVETFTGLTGGPASAAHIHCCGAPGTNDPVAVPFTAFPTTTSGTFAGTFDLTNIATYTSAFVTAEGGTAASAETALIAGLNSNQTYVNIHNAQFPGGEIRGFITVAPEPGTLWLAGGLLTLCLCSRTYRTRLPG